MLSKLKKVDYIIVGNGTSGAVLARKLTDDYKTSVIVLEAGVNHNNDPIVQTSNWSPYINELAYYPQRSLTYCAGVYDSFVVNYSVGCGWGGSSMHNFMISVRGSPAVYDGWAAATGREAWSYNRMLPLMKSELEHYTPDGTILNLAQRGTTGPLDITQGPVVTGDAYLQAMSTAWILPFVSDYNDPSEGVVGISGTQTYTQPVAPFDRAFSQTAFVIEGETINSQGDGLKGRKLQIISEAFVNRIIFKHKKGCIHRKDACTKSVCTCKPKAKGVEYCVTKSDGSQCIQIVYAKKIILSAGSVNSPAILERSGVGDPAILQPLGIPVIVSNPNVGNNGVNQVGIYGIMSGTVGNDVYYTAFTDGSPIYPVTGERIFQVFPENAGDPASTAMFLAISEPKSICTVHCIIRDPKIQPQVKLNFYSDGPVTQQFSDANKAVTAYKLMSLLAT